MTKQKGVYTGIIEKTRKEITFGGEYLLDFKEKLSIRETKSISNL
jgi:hypothetical protein